MSAQGLKFKTDFKGDIRVLRGQNSSEIALVALREHCQRCYHLTSFSMRYTDDENDVVTIDTVDDLEDAMKLARNKGKTLKIHVISQDSEEKVAEDEAEVNSATEEPPRKKSLMEELRDNVEFRSEAIAFLQTLLVTFRNDDQRNFESAVQVAIDNHPTISQHPDFVTYHVFATPMLNQVTKESMLATVICALDPAYVPELFNKVLEMMIQGRCDAFASMLIALSAGIPPPLFMSPYSARPFINGPRFHGGCFGGNNGDSVTPPRCHCGSTMQKRVANGSYKSRRQPQAVICDICDKKFHGDTMVLHCTKGQCEAHAGGFDVCLDCASARGHQVCQCGGTMQVITADDCYPHPKVIGVYCDDCGGKCVGTTEIYHCPQEYCQNHPLGADLCLPCGNHRRNPLMPATSRLRFFPFGRRFGGCPHRRARHGGGGHRGCPRRRGSEPGKCVRKDREKCEKMKVGRNAKLEHKRDRLQNKLRKLESKLNHGKKTEESTAMDTEEEEQEQVFVNVERVPSVESLPSHDSSDNINDEMQPLVVPQEFQAPVVVEPCVPYVYARQLMMLAGMGFNQEQAKRALENANGDVNQAINALLLQ